MKYMNTEHKKLPKGLTYEISGISFFCSKGNAKEEMQYFRYTSVSVIKFPANIDSRLSLCSPNLLLMKRTEGWGTWRLH